MDSVPAAPEVVENALLGGRVRLRQPARGYRAGMDAALLAAACDALPGDRVIEAGCGAGAVLMHNNTTSEPRMRQTPLVRPPAAGQVLKTDEAVSPAPASAGQRASSPD